MENKDKEEKKTKSKKKDESKLSKKEDKKNKKNEKKELRKNKRIEKKKIKADKKIAKKQRKEEQQEEKLYFSMAEVVVVFLVALLLGLVVGGLAVLSKTNGDKNLEDFHSFYYDISKNYYKKVDKKELINAAISGMLSYLGDPYSTYMDKKATKEFDTTINGSYKGIGITIGFVKEKPTVIGVFDDSPAKKVGIKENDIFVKVNGNSVEGKTLDEIVKMVKSKRNVTIVVSRKNKEKTFKLNLDKINVPSVSSKITEKNNKKVGIISIDVFSANTYKEFNSHLKKLEKEKIDSLIIDVRSNPGGHLSQVTKVLSLFMDKKKVLYQIKSIKNTKKVYSRTNEKRDYKIAVLINESSASASEVLTAAMKESYGAVVVGVKSYGKGTVQKEYSLNSGSSVKYTTEQWLTPKGESINGKGIEPTNVVELDDNYKANPSEETDNQLQTALDLVTENEKKKED